jgi:hypothetical protein
MLDKEECIDYDGKIPKFLMDVLFNAWGGKENEWEINQRFSRQRRLYTGSSQDWK